MGLPLGLHAPRLRGKLLLAADEVALGLALQLRVQLPPRGWVCGLDLVGFDGVAGDVAPDELAPDFAGLECDVGGVLFDGAKMVGVFDLEEGGAQPVVGEVGEVVESWVRGLVKGALRGLDGLGTYGICFS